MKIKKVLAMCLISAMVLGSFAGCGKDEGESTVSVNQEDPAWKEAMTTPYGKYPETVNYYNPRKLEACFKLAFYANSG